MNVTLKIETHFDAAHYLPNYPGKCARLHGHTYRVEVEVTGKVESKTGMFIDFSILKEEVNKIINKLDHNLINDIMEDIPTAENIAKWIKFELLKSEKLKEYDITDISVTVFEGLNNAAKV